jgi:hypothetical protein
VQLLQLRVSAASVELPRFAALGVETVLVETVSWRSTQARVADCIIATFTAFAQPLLAASLGFR